MIWPNDIHDLQTQLCAAQDLDSVRSVAKHVLPTQPTPTESGVHVALMVALRVTELVCQSIDQLLEQPASHTRGAFHDAGMYRPCRGNREPHGPADQKRGLRELIPMIDVVTYYLQKLEPLDDYASVVTRLVQASSFHHESDDLVVHRCLIASHALSEGYIGAKQSKTEYNLRRRLSAWSPACPLPQGRCKTRRAADSRGPNSRTSSDHNM